MNVRKSWIALMLAACPVVTTAGDIQMLCVAAVKEPGVGGREWVSVSHPYAGTDTFDLEYRIRKLDRGFDQALRQAGAPEALVRSASVVCGGFASSEIERKAQEWIEQRRKQSPKFVNADRFTLKLAKYDPARFPIKPMPADPFASASAKNPTKAEAWGLKASDFWLQDESYLLGMAGLRPGHPVKPEKLARARSAAEAGDHYAQFLYGLYLAASGKPKESLAFLEKASSAGLLPAAWVWANIAQNDVRSLSVLRDAADAGVPMAQAQVAGMLAGNGHSPEQRAAALRYARAADANGMKNNVAFYEEMFELHDLEAHH